ncbi:GGDEF domain-containing protein [Aliirhizobium smilacinae]|nr:diguanylate cyclase [Rhizobium smilacinae]
MMNGVAFFLGVNFVVAVCFSAVFAVVATRSRSRRAALWLAAGFGVASLSAVCELLVAYTASPKIWAIGAFATVLTGMMLLRVGIGHLYARRLDKRIAAFFVGASIILCYAIYELPRGTPLQAFSYQSPFAIILLDSAFVVLSSRGRQTVDRFLGMVLLFTGLHFFAKAGVAVLVGAGSAARDYIHTNYALISQSATAILVVAVGLTLLATLVLEIMADQRSESEKDTLSMLANRRGFDRQVQSLLSEAPNGKHAVILCDLDHFKRINDTYGHHVGDLVIQGFGHLMNNSAPKRAALGRIGGEEFAIFLPDTEIGAAVLFAQALRGATMTLPDLPESLSVTASFGVSPLTSAAGLIEAYRRADIALYTAKNAGRNQVKLAAGDRAETENQRGTVAPDHWKT